MKEDLIERLVETFKEETKKQSDTLEGVKDYKIEEFFKRNNPKNGYHSVDASIVFDTFTLKLEYKINVSMLIPKSIIEIRFMFEDGKLPVEYSIYDLFNIIDLKNFKCYTFASVTSEKKVIEIIKKLIKVFLKYRNKIEELSTNLDKIATLEQDIKEKIKLILNEDVFDTRDAFYLMNMLEIYYALDVARFTSESYDGYICYLKGNYKKAIKKYSKLKEKVTKYEKRLIEYMKDNAEKENISQDMNTTIEANSLKNTKMVLIPMFIGWIVLTPVWCVVYYIIFKIAFEIFTRGTIYSGGSEVFMLFMPAFITAIINSYFIRKFVYKILYKKDYDKIIALDEIENKHIDGFMSKLFQFIIASCIVTTILMANTNISFYEEYFNNNLEFTKLKGENISYMDVNSVYKAYARINDFGQTIEYPTYVIVLNDGRKIDLYFDMDFEEVKKNIIPIFENKNIEIKEIDFVENIK